MNDNQSVKKIKIVYYSGTGSTAIVADHFYKIFQKKDIATTKYSLKAGTMPNEEDEDLLLVIYTVHALNAPEPVYKWIGELSKTNKAKAAVISVSGGGEVSPNTACRVECIKRLQAKGYEVFYERMLVMPSNWIVATKEPLAVKLLEVLPQRAEKIVEDLLAGKTHKMTPKFIDRMLSKLSELEKTQSKFFGKKISKSEKCNKCGWCSTHCPAGNIKMEADGPVFQNKCHMCLNCIYGCPQKALQPGIGKFVVIKEGYNLKELEKKVPYPEPVDVENLAKGYVWKGVKNYLLEEE